ncbi:MAG: hypothetical protein CSA22_04510 [Deltaproteobacteria bacterium]|nr:MAG: hypothetical protein CSA22_04510 [Deltaproteobacteria bacterium]
MVAVVVMTDMGNGAWEAATEPVVKTGITDCTDGSAVITPCPSPGDRFYGQDACYQKGADRSCTKLGVNGVELADTATPADGWCMTRDNVTDTNANCRAPRRPVCELLMD